eukprot:jgi/Tetstr1/445869/TSEL_033508.t1
MATHAKLIPGTPYGKAVRPEGMTIPLGSDMGTSAKNATVDVPSLAVSTSQGRESTLKTKDKAVLSDVFDECWPRDTQTGIPYPLKKTPRFPIAAPPYIERIAYATFNYRAGYTADNHIYAKEAVLTAFRECTLSPFRPTPLRPSLWVVLTVHLVMYRKQGNALDLAEEWHQTELGRYYQAGKCLPANAMFKGEEEVCEVDAALGSRNCVAKLHGLVGALAQQQKRAGGIIKHNTNAVKNLAATQSRPRRQRRRGQ